MSDWLDFLGSDGEEAVTRNRQRIAAASDAAGVIDDRLESRSEKRKKRTSAWWYAGVVLAATAVGFVAYALYVEFGYLVWPRTSWSCNQTATPRVHLSVELDALFGDGKNSDVDTLDPDAEVQEFEIEEAPEEDEGAGGIGWKMLTLFVCGGLVITALAVAFMVWVIEGLVLWGDGCACPRTLDLAV